MIRSLRHLVQPAYIPVAGVQAELDIAHLGMVAADAELAADIRPNRPCDERPAGESVRNVVGRMSSDTLVVACTESAAQEGEAVGSSGHSLGPGVEVERVPEGGSCSRASTVGERPEALVSSAQGLRNESRKVEVERLYFEVDLVHRYDYGHIADCSRRYRRSSP
jgi:hypothetical protein